MLSAIGNSIPYTQSNAHAVHQSCQRIPFLLMPGTVRSMCPCAADWYVHPLPHNFCSPPVPLQLRTLHVSLWLVAHFAKSSGRYWWRCRNDKTNVAFLFLSSIARLRMQVFNLYIETEISFTPPYFPACHLVEARSPVQSFLLPVALRGSLVLANASVPLLPVQGFASYG